MKRLREVGFATLFAATLATNPAVYADGEMLSADDMAAMNEAMQQAEEALNNMDPETRKQFEEFVRHAQTSSPGVATLDSPVDRKSLLNKISKEPMTPTQLKHFVDGLLPKVSEAMSDDVEQRALKVEVEMNKFPDAINRMRGASNVLAALGAWPEAAYLSARVAQQTGNTQDISNLAAFLTILRAESASIPLLHTLNARYPSNSTILNNLGLAYYQLGDEEKAEAFLLSAIRSSPKHPQANMTRALIQESKGDSAAAQKSIHAALEGGYSDTKADRLMKNGGSLRNEDIRWRRRVPADPLGVQSLSPTVYLEDVSTLPSIIALRDTSESMVQSEAEKLNQRAQALPPPTMQSMLAAKNMPFARRANAIIQMELDHNRIAHDRLGKAIAETIDKSSQAQLRMNDAIARIDADGEEKYAGVPGGYQFNYTCDAVKGEMQKYVEETLAATRNYELEMADLQLREANTRVYFSQFTLPASEFERLKWSTKAGFVRGPVGGLGIIQALEGEYNKRLNACWGKKEEEAHKFALPNFNDIRCDAVANFTVPGFGSASWHCDKVSVSFDSPFVPFSGAWSTKDTGRGDETMLTHASAAIQLEALKIGGHSEFDEQGWKSGGVDVGVDVKPGTKLSGGPLEIKVGGELTGTVEFDRSGLTDVAVGGSLGAEASSTYVSTDQGGQISSTLESSIANRWSWNAGYSGESSTGFSGSAFDAG